MTAAVAELEDDEDDAPVEAVDPRSIPVRFSNLKAIGQSPQHYWHSCQRRYEKSVLCRTLGTAAHALTFGTPPVVVWPARKAGKAWLAFKAEHELAGDVVLNASEHRAALAMATALRSDPHAGPLMFAPDVRYEVQVNWQFMGRDCTGRIDAIGDTNIIDLKSARTAEPGRFASAGRWMNYHAQIAWYLDGCAAAGLGPRVPYIVAVESGAPNPVVAMKLTDRAIDQGRAIYRGWLERLRVCEDSNDWPGYAQSVVDFDVPDDAPFSLLIDGDDTEVD